MNLGALVPLALGGDSITGSQTAMALLALASIIGGWMLLAGLWYFVFREGARCKGTQGERQRATAGRDPRALRERRGERP